MSSNREFYRLIEDQTVTRFANQTSFNPRGLR